MVALLLTQKGVEYKIEGKKVAMIIAPNNFRDEELFVPKEILEKSGAKVFVVSKDVSEARGMLGGRAKVEIDLKDLNVDDFDAIVFVGGTGASIYFDDKKALEIAKRAFEKNKVLAAICIAPSILANAGVLEGKRATAFPSEEENLKEKGAIYTDEDVTVDGKIVTAKGPFAAEKFGREIARLLSS